MRVRDVVPMSILVLFISLMPSLSHALSITITNGGSSVTLTTLGAGSTATSGYISLAGVGTVGDVTVGTCAGCAGPARVSFLDGGTVDKMWLTDLSLTSTGSTNLTTTITFSNTFSTTTASAYPVGPALNETFSGSGSFASGTATLTQLVQFDNGEDCCTNLSTRSVTDPVGGATFNQSNPGTLTHAAFAPIVTGTYTVTFNAVGDTIRLPGSAELIQLKTLEISYDDARAIQDGFAVPEASSLFLLGAGLVALWGLGRKRLVA